jgi:hypothetical protein
LTPFFFQVLRQPVNGIRPFAEFNFFGVIGEVGSQVGAVDVDNQILGVDLNPEGWKSFNGDPHKWSLLFIKSLYVR